MAENKPQESKQKEKKPQGTKKKKKSQQNGQGTREEAPNAETPAAEEDQELADDKPQKGCEQKGKKQKMKKEKGQNTTEGAPKAKTKDNSKDTTPEPASEAAAGEAGETPAVEEEKEEESKTKMAANNDDVKKIAGAIKDLKIERDIDSLMKKAETFSDGSWTEIQYMYRNKSPEYFKKLVDKVMTKRVKDKTGTIRSPINGKLHGVFFCVTLNNGKNLPTISPYGSTRVEIPLNGLINSKTNLYFADFYCFKEGGNHYNVLVLAQNGSEADVFCQKNLKQLNWNDKYFFRKNEENVFEYKHKKGLWVELFYTESVDLKMIDGVKWTYDIGIMKGEYKNISKYSSCQICNI